MNKHKISVNVLIIVLVSILSNILFLRSGVLENAGMAALILNWLPAIIGIGIIVFYFIVRAIKKEYAWVVTLLGICFLTFLVIRVYW